MPNYSIFQTAMEAHRIYTAAGAAAVERYLLTLTANGIALKENRLNDLLIDLAVAVSTPHRDLSVRLLPVTSHFTYIYQDKPVQGLVWGITINL